MTNLQQYERSYCGCDSCVGVCRKEPPFLASGDLMTLATQFGATQGDDFKRFLEAKFSACDPVEHFDEFGEPILIPVIRPKMVTHEVGQNGELHPVDNPCCVFLASSRNQCRVHAWAPFLCRTCNACDTTGNDERQKAALDSLMGDVQYMKHWSVLRAHQEGT